MSSGLAPIDLNGHWIPGSLPNIDFVGAQELASMTLRSSRSKEYTTRENGVVAGYDELCLEVPPRSAGGGRVERPPLRRLR